MILISTQSAALLDQQKFTITPYLFQHVLKILSDVKILTLVFNPCVKVKSLAPEPLRYHLKMHEISRYLTIQAPPCLDPDLMRTNVDLKYTIVGLNQVLAMCENPKKTLKV